MMKNMQLKILTPAAKVCDLAISMVVFSAEDGRQAVMPGHVAMIVALGMGVVNVYVNQEIHQQFLIADGVAEITGEQIILMVNDAEIIENINLDTERNELRVMQRMLTDEKLEENRVIIKNKLQRKKVIIDTAVQKV